MKHLISLIIFITSFYIATPVNAQFNWVSAGLEGGIIKSIYIRSDGVVYAGTQRGVYISVNFGSTWVKGTENLYQYGINAIIVVGTMVFAAADNGGLYISYDNGYNFSLLNSGNYINTFCKIDQTLYAGLAGSTMNSGILMSTNYGVNWIQTNMPGNIVVNDIITDDVALYAATNNGVYLAYNPGTSWTKYDLGIPANTKVFSLKKAGYIILAGTDKGVYRSTDNGTSWNAANSGLTTSYPYFAVTIQGSNAYACQFGKAVYKASNYGDNWVQLNSPGLNDNLIYKFGVYNTNLFCASAGGGMYVSVDNGTSFIPSNSGLNVHTVNTLHYIGNVMFAGTQGGGVYRSLNLGANWVAKNDLLANTIVYSLIDAGGYLFAGTYGGVFRNLGGGTTWEAMNTGLVDSVILSLNYNGANLFAGTQGGGIYRSTNLGGSWTKLAGIILNDTVYSLTNIGTTVFASTKRNGFVKSEDNGATWQAIINGFAAPPLSLSITSRGSDLYASVFLGSPQRGIFKSTDSGNSWNWISNPVSAASYFVTTYLNIIFASYLDYSGGIIRMTTNEGASWTIISSTVTQWGDNCDVKCIKVFNNYVYAGTSGKSLWRIPLSEVVSAEKSPVNIPEKFCLYQNYPNPFNSKTIINYGIPSNGNKRVLSSLKLFDILGNEVRTLLNEEKNPGSYSLTFDSKDLPSGVYFYVLSSESFRESKIMILLK